MSSATIKDIKSIRVIYNDARPNTYLRLIDTIERQEATNIMGAIKGNPEVMTCIAYTTSGTEI